MKTLFALFIVFGITLEASSATLEQIHVYLLENGYSNAVSLGKVQISCGLYGDEIAVWNIDLAKPSDDSVRSHAECVALLKLPKEQRKVDGGKLRAKTAEELASEDVTANLGIYAYQNAFLMLCDNVRGDSSHVKLPFETLPGLLKAIRKGGDKSRFEDLRDSFNTINQALIKKAGVNWWDSCVWHTDATVIATAQSIYNGLLDP